MTKPAPAKYQTTNWKAYNAALKARGSLMIWLDRDMPWHGAPMLPELLNQISQEEKIATVSGDGAYDTKGCHEAIAQRQAEAVIPTRKNAKPWQENRPGRRFETKSCAARVVWVGRSGKSGAVTIGAVWWKPRCVASNCWASGSWRGIDRQVAELQVRAAILNRFTHLGTPITVRMP